MLVIVMFLAKTVSLILLNADNDTGTHDTNMETFVNYIRENTHAHTFKASAFLNIFRCVLCTVTLKKKYPRHG